MNRRLHPNFAIASVVTGFIGLFLFASSASAQNMPRYDVDRHCKKIASFGGNYSDMLFEGCETQEQESYDVLKPIWASLPGSMRGHCNQIATFADAGSYMMLKGCIDQEVDAAKTNRSTTFHY